MSDTQPSSPGPFQRLWRIFRPSRRTLTMLAMSLLPLLICCCCLTMGVMANGLGSTQSSQPGVSVAMLAFVSLAVIPASLVFVALAATLEPHTPPRAVLWSVVSLMLALDGVVLVLTMVLDPMNGVGWQTGIGFALMVVAPLFLVFSMPAVYFGAKAFPQVRAALLDGRSERALEAILAHGEITFGKLSLAVDIPLAEVDNVVDGLLHSGRLVGTVDTARQVIYTAAALAERQWLLLDTVQRQGRVHLDDLAALLKAPRSVVRDWVYQLVQRDQFSGYINWDDGWLYSALAEKIGANSQCPSCGGKLAPQGASIVCLHCHSEILV